MRLPCIGCGEGYLSRLMSHMNTRYVGVDSSESLIAIAKNRWSHLNDSNLPYNNDVSFINIDIDNNDNISTLDQIFIQHGYPHIVTCIITLEHLETPLPLLKYLSACLSAKN